MNPYCSQQHPKATEHTSPRLEAALVPGLTVLTAHLTSCHLRSKTPTSTLCVGCGHKCAPKKVREGKLCGGPGWIWRWEGGEETPPHHSILVCSCCPGRRAKPGILPNLSVKRQECILDTFSLSLNTKSLYFTGKKNTSLPHHNVGSLKTQLLPCMLPLQI